MGRLPDRMFKRQYQLKEMRELQQEMARRITLGQKNVDIARELDVCPQSVSIARNSAVVEEHIAELESQADAATVSVTSRIKALAERALDVLEETLKDETVGKVLKSKIAMDLLDRAGHSGVQKIQKVSATLSPDDIAALKANARSAGILTVERSESEDAV